MCFLWIPASLLMLYMPARPPWMAAILLPSMFDVRNWQKKASWRSKHLRIPSRQPQLAVVGVKWQSAAEALNPRKARAETSRVPASRSSPAARRARSRSWRFYLFRITVEPEVLQKKKKEKKRRRKTQARLIMLPLLVTLLMPDGIVSTWERGFRDDCLVAAGLDMLTMALMCRVTNGRRTGDE